MRKINLAIFASGSGSNAENIFNYFTNNKSINVNIILCNNPNAYVLKRFEKNSIKKIIFSKDDLQNSDFVDKILNDFEIDFIILAGFLLKIPERLIQKYNYRIINIHPSLLPSYGGKGMYGMNVHNAVIAAGEKKSGITIHLIDEIYDNGKILFQAECDIQQHETADILANKIHTLEQKHFAHVIEEFILKNQ